MSSLQELMGEKPLSLDSFVSQEPMQNSLPEATVRNQAALVAIQSDDPDAIVPSFNSMMADNAVGSDSTMQELSAAINQQNEETDFQTLTEMLSDPTLSVDAKASMVESFQTSRRLKDMRFSLADKSLMQESPGENLEQEAVRLSTSEMLAPYFEDQKERQNMVNAFNISTQQSTGENVVDFGALLVPGADAITNLTVSQEIGNVMGIERGVWANIRDFIAPGFSALEVRKNFEAKSFEEQTELVSQILDVIKNNSGIMASDENQIRAMQMLNRFLIGDYDTVDAVADSVFNVLDLIGVGATIKAGIRATKGVDEAAEAARIAARQEPSLGEKTPPSASTGSVAPSVMPEARLSARGSEVAALEDEYAEALTKTQSALDPGAVRNLRSELEVIARQDKEARSIDLRARTKELQAEGITFKEAQKAAKKEIDDRVAEIAARRQTVEQRLSINASSEKARSSLADLEKRISAAKADTTTVPARLNPIMDAIHRVKLNSTFAPENPAAAGHILSDMNPSKGRSLFEAIYRADSDEVAMAAFGVSKQDYLTSQVLPQVSTESGKVRARVPDVQRTLADNLDEGGLRFTAKERDNMLAQVVHDLKSATGLEVHDAEGAFRVKADGQNAVVSAMYGTAEGGFLRAEDAVEQGAFALRKYGITPDRFTVMQKTGLDYVPVDLKDVRGIDGDFKIRIDTEIPLDMDTIGDGWEALDVKRNFFDRFSSTMFEGAGSLTRALTDAASNLHPTIAGSLSVATDVATVLEKNLLKMADKFAVEYNKLSASRKNKMWEYLIEANEKGLPFDTTQLMAKGFTPSEMDTMRHFRNFWDAHYELENLDVIRTLRAQNYQMLSSPNGTQLFARPIPKNKNHNTVYDPSTDSIVTLGQKELDDLYSQGGTVSAFKAPIDFNGTEASYMMVRNTPTEYLRKINDTDRALNYREGYFQINYKAPKFIREKQANGTYRAVAVAGDKYAADLAAKRLSQQNGKEYVITGDERGIRRDSQEYWELNSAGGRIAQRRRGQALEGSKGVNHIDGSSFIENPIDSAIRAARSIAGRTLTRPAIETAKARAMKQYGHLLNRDEYGRPKYPNSLSEIGVVGEYTTKELADARTTFENIRRFENGYINNIDDMVKAGWNYVANTLGDLNVATGGKLSKAERTAQLASEGRGVTNVFRATAFQAYIALNPFRNWIMQPAQVARTVAYNPIDWLNGTMGRFMVEGSLAMSGVKVSNDVMDMVRALEKTGMLDAVDRSNLVRGAMLQAADSSTAGGRLIAKGFETSRKIGFDIGEKVNLFGHYAAVWTKYRRQGFDLSDSRVLARIHSEARAIAGEMNKAGDLAYNQNSFSAVFQFAQVPHKFVLGMTNRKLDRATRARMAVGDVVLWGVPGTYAMTSFFGEDILPEDPELRELFNSGVAAYITNDALSLLAGDDSRIDFSSLAPYNLGGFSDMFKSMWSEGAMSVVLNSPSGQLFFKDSGRIGAAMRSAARHFAPIEEGLETPETWLDTLNQVAKISSGWNNITKAYMAYTMGTALDKFNVPTDTSVTNTEAIGMAFGFPTQTTAQHYNTIMKLMDNKKANESVAKDLVSSIMQMYANAYAGESATNPEYVTRLTGALMSITKVNPALAEQVYGLIRLRLSDPNDATTNNIMKAIEMPDIDNLDSVIRDSALPQDRKDTLLKILSDVKNMREQMKED